MLQSLAFFLHYFIVFKYCFHCLAAAHWTSTRSQEHTKYLSTRFLHVVMFSESCIANKSCWCQVSGRRPEETEFSAKMSRPTIIWLKWALREGNNKYVKKINCDKLFISEVKKSDWLIVHFFQRQVISQVYQSSALSSLSICPSHHSSTPTSSHSTIVIQTTET